MKAERILNKTYLNLLSGAWIDDILNPPTPPTPPVEGDLFYWRDGTIEVKAPAQYIDYAEYQNNTNLVGVKLLSATLIGMNAFQGCTNLEFFEALQVSGGADNLMQGAFADCPSLTGVTLGTITELDENVFSGCTSLVSFDTTNLQRIGSSAFAGCRSMTSLIAPDLTEISYNGLEGCTNLTSLSFPLLTTILTNAMKGCTGLTSVSFPAVTTILNGAFENCTSLQSFTSSTFNGYLSDDIFKGCTSLSSVTMTMANVPNTSWGGQFSGCTNLEEVHLYGGERGLIQGYQDTMFDGCHKLSLIWFDYTIATSSDWHLESWYPSDILDDIANTFPSFFQNLWTGITTRIDQNSNHKVYMSFYDELYNHENNIVRQSFRMIPNVDRLAQG